MPKRAKTIRARWSMKNRPRWCMDVAFGDDRMRARTQYAAHNMAMLKHITMSLIRLDPIPRKGGIKTRRLIAATPDHHSSHLFNMI
jgi:predicted transposase YbfD/YdcC